MALATNHHTVALQGLKHFSNYDAAISVGTTEATVIEWDVSGCESVVVIAKNTHATQQLFIRLYGGANETDNQQSQLLSRTLSVENQKLLESVDCRSIRWVRLTVQGSAATTTGSVSLENQRRA